jgi:hypothetical protein
MRDSGLKGNGHKVACGGLWGSEALPVFDQVMEQNSGYGTDYIGECCRGE